VIDFNVKYDKVHTNSLKLNSYVIHYPFHYNFKPGNNDLPFVLHL